MSKWHDGDGYPTDAALERIRTWPHDDFSGLLEFVESIWWLDGEWGVWDWENTTDLGRPITRHKLATGGWSGNESIIEAMHKNIIFWLMCWESSRRGGLHTFTTPRSLHTEPTDPTGDGESER